MSQIPAAGPPLRLVCVQGLVVGSTFDLTPPEFTIGREVGNLLPLADQTLSRRHARLSFAGVGWMIEDLGSANGVLVNGVRIGSPTAINAGDGFQIGAQAFRLEAIVQAHTKRIEVGSAEGPRTFAAMPASAPLNPANGCMPDISGIERDLSGCLGALARLLPWLLAALLAFLVLWLLMSGAGALIAAFQGGAGHHAPPPPPQQGQDQPPPGPAPAPSEQTSGEGVTIIDAHVDNTAEGPVVKIKWRNDTSKPISTIKGDLSVVDPGGESIIDMKEITLFQGDPVPAGETHEPGKLEGIGLPLGAAKGTIKVVPKTVG